MSERTETDVKPPAGDEQDAHTPNGNHEEKPSSRKRRPFRREQILTEAVRLFNERGYHATGMNDIGAAVGITGAGIYRHFENKQAILEAALLESGDRMLEDVQQIREAATSPQDTLTRLVNNFVSAMLNYPALSATVMVERRQLSGNARAWVSRALRLYQEEWVHALLQVRPELSEIEARVICAGALSLSYSIDRFWADLDQERLAQLLRDMTWALLFAEKDALPEHRDVADKAVGT